MYLRNSVQRGTVAIIPALRYLPRSVTAPKASSARTTARSLSSAATATAGGYDVIIIGAGVIGNSCALQLNRKGYRTLNIDKGPAAGSGSTSYSSGNLRSMC
jgi:heterodisulfide reductase subunit A-like polyferredoxin